MTIQNFVKKKTAQFWNENPLVYFLPKGVAAVVVGEDLEDGTFLAEDEGAQLWHREPDFCAMSSIEAG